MRSVVPRLIILLTILFAKVGNAQPDDFLFMNTWYIDELIVDGEDVPLPNNPELYNAVLNFNDQTPYTFDLTACRMISGEILYPQIERFKLPALPNISGVICTQTLNQTFEALLFQFFADFIDQEFEYLSVYVDPDPPNYYLFITNPNGDQAIFNEVPNILLGVDDAKIQPFSVYPNPVQTLLYADSIKAEPICIKLISIYGQLLVNQENFPLDMSFVSSGVYFVEVDSENAIHRFKVLKK